VAFGLTVTDFGDNGGPGQLRTLINAAASGDVIFIPPGPPIVLSGPADEDANASGDLDITKDLIIAGSGPDVTVIDGAMIDRVFDIKGASPRVTISGLTIQHGNPPAFGGGGISKAFGSLTLVSVVLRENKADTGGAIANNGTLDLANVEITGNEATVFNGGGIFHSAGVIKLADVTVDNNKALLNAGGLELSVATSTLTNVTISNNKAPDGAGIRNSGGTINGAPFGVLTMVNVTISGNTATGRGGGLLNDGTGEATLTNVTFSGNSAAAGGAIARNGDSPVMLKNTIVADSPLGGNCEFAITTDGHNLEDADTCGLSAGMNDLIDTPANLLPLADNLGLTKTHALAAPSFAINGGDNIGCPATDQRGIIRPQQFTCDIGAYERVPQVLPVGQKPRNAPALGAFGMLSTAAALLLYGALASTRRAPRRSRHGS
jgi:hypothetical protein